MDPTTTPQLGGDTTPAKKQRFKWQPEQVKELETIFVANHHPPLSEMEKLATKYSADISNVKSWFANRRTKEKRNSTLPDSPTKTTTTTTTNTNDTTNNNNNNNDNINTSKKEEETNDLPASVIASAGVPMSHQPIVEMDVNKLHARIKELEAENYYLKQQLAKRQREGDAPQVAEPPAKKKKGGKSESERLFHAWGKRLSTIAKTVKFYGSYDVSEVVVEESLTKELFTQCFVGKGNIIQPTPDNKPKSKVWIIKFATWENIEQLFGTGNIKKDGHIAWIWSRGGVPQRGFGFFGGGGGGFSKSEKVRKSTAHIISLEVHYNETHSKLQLKFSCGIDGGGGFGMFDDSD